MTRLQTLQSKGKTPDMPPLGASGYLVDHLFDVGPVSQTGMGPAPLAWSEIESWQRTTGHALTSWEARTLRRLSLAYIDAQQAAQAIDAPAPYSPAPTAESRARTSNALAALFARKASHARR